MGGISHIEDLKNSDFIDTIHNLKKYSLTEKIDGVELWFGIDDIGFYTSREGKSATKPRCYSVSDYQMIADHNAFRFAHTLLKSQEQNIRKILNTNDVVSIQIVMSGDGRAISYDNGNHIVFIDRLQTPTDRYNKLVDFFNNKQIKVCIFR